MVTSVIGAVTSLVSLGETIAKLLSGCGSTCTLTSDEANNISSMMAQNLSAYLAAPVSAANQQQAMANFTGLWSTMFNYCNNPSMGTAGQNCISQRENGACAYKTSPGGWAQESDGTWSYTYPGANGSGSTCWNYFVGYYDPIANDPRVAALGTTTAMASTGSTTSTTAGTTDLTPLLLIAGGIALAMLVL